jgi:hypothetical protein
VSLGGLDHLLEQRPVALLDRSPPGDLGLGLAQARRERVANPLELGQAEHPRAAGGGDPPLDPAAGEGGREQLAEPPLEERDLATQLGPDPALDVRRRGGRDASDLGSRDCDRVPLKQLLGHP